MDLLGLPDEVILHIIESLYDESLINFSLSCRRIHQIATSALEESKAYSDYCRVIVRSTTSYQNTPLAMIYEITKDPKIAKHVRELVYLEAINNHRSTNCIEDTQAMLESRAWLEGPLQDLVDAEILTDDEKTQQQVLLREENWSITWLVLYLMLPNLTTISFSDVNGEFHDMADFLLRYVNCFELRKRQVTTLGALVPACPQPSGPKIPSPTTMKLYYYRTTNCSDYNHDFSKYFLLPSLQSLNIARVPHEYLEVSERVFPYAPMKAGLELRQCRDLTRDGNSSTLLNGGQLCMLASKISHVEITDVDLPPENLLLLLRDLPALERLTYENRLSSRNLVSYNEVVPPSFREIIDIEQYVTTVIWLGWRFLNDWGLVIREFDRQSDGWADGDLEVRKIDHLGHHSYWRH